MLENTGVFKRPCGELVALMPKEWAPERMLFRFFVCFGVERW